MVPAARELLTTHDPAEVSINLIARGRLLEEDLLTAIVGVILIFTLIASCAAMACGIACLVASGTGARPAAVALVVEGGALTVTSMVFSFYVLIPDDTAWATASPSFGAAAAFVGGLTMAAGGIAASTMARGPRPSAR